MQKKKKIETPLEKLCRLQHEVSQLRYDLDAVACGKGTKDKTDKVSVNINDVENDVSSILNDARIAPYLAKDAHLSKAGIHSEEANVSGALIDQLRDFGGGGKGVSYQLYAEKTGAEKMRLIELDRKIGTLERKVGSVDDKEKVGFEELNDALSGLYSKLELLDGHKLESIQRRLSSLNTEFELLEGNMPKLKNNTKSSEKQFNELYSHMKKWNKCTIELPQFVARLESQVSVHTEHSETILRVQKLRRQQLALNTLLKSDQEALKNANKSLHQNMAIMNKNIKNFKKRFTELEKKIKKC